MNYEVLCIKPNNDYAYELYKNNEEQIARNDSGYDLYYCGETITIMPFQEQLLGLGICAELLGEPHGYELWPRSSIRKTPLQLSNSIGLIDFGYRGEIMATVRNLSNDNYIVKKGSKLFQLCMPNKKPFRVEIIGTLSETIRNKGGFGSTNKSPYINEINL